MQIHGFAFSKHFFSLRVRVGHDHYRNDIFSRISTTNLSAMVGTVVVGPFNKNEKTPGEIKYAAFYPAKQGICTKVQEQRKNILYIQMEVLLRIFLMVQSNSPWKDIETLSIDKIFDRLRLYLCERGRLLADFATFVLVWYIYSVTIDILYLLFL